MAEAVETQQQGDQLRDWGWEFAQGYFYAKPLGAEAAWQFLYQNLSRENSRQTELVF